MTPTVGGRLGSYEIVCPLGAGGMGEVYRAHDSRLGRDVALKILPDLFARDPDRLARFEREARALASLNHPNIAQIYGVEESGGTRALIMEFVPGRTLEEILATREPTSASEATAIARQIGEALSAAHDCGIVHRDLKPANVKVRDDGTVKVLDFGLARAFDPAGSGTSPGTQALPTVTSPAFTALGVILGTAAYMAPEQARGQPVDKRADIWAFGVVLFEMLSGRRLFDGQTVSDTLASVLRQDVPWGALPASTPPSLRWLLQRCLERDPKKRLRDIGDAWLDDLVTAPDAGSTDRPARRRRWYAAAWAASVLLTAGGAALAAWIARTPPEAAARRFTIPTEDDTAPAEAAISPDGRFVAHATAGKVWLQQLTDARPRHVPGSEQGQSLFWSPDSAWLGFQARGQLWKIAVNGGTEPIAIAPVAADFTVVGGAAWLPNGRIVFSTGSSALYDVPAAGGTPKIVLGLEQGKDYDFHEVRPLTGTNTVLFVVHPADVTAPFTLDAFDGTRRTRVFTAPRDIRSPAYSPTGHLLFVQESGVWAIALDGKTLATSGDPFLVEPNAVSPSLAGDGTLVMAPGAAGEPQELVWIDRAGHAGGTLSTVNAPIAGIRVSPDGTQAVASVNAGGNADLWLFDTRRVAEQRLTREPDADISPAWLRNGAIAYSCARKLCTRSADGSSGRQIVYEGPIYGVVSTPDGTGMLLSQAGVTTLSDIFVMDAPPAPGSASRAALRPVITAERQQRRSDVSPDGKYIAYESNENGRYEIFVSRFPSGEGKWDVSRGAGLWPRWSVKGDRLFFADERSRIVEVDVQLAPSFSVGARRFALQAQPPGVDPERDGFDRSLDGTRFLMARARDGNRRRTALAVVENWSRLYRGQQMQ